MSLRPGYSWSATTYGTRDGSGVPVGAYESVPNHDCRYNPALPAKIAETLYPLEISVEGGEVSGR